MYEKGHDSPKLEKLITYFSRQLCDDDCHIILDKKRLTAVKNNKIIHKGVRNPTDGLWDIPVGKTHISPQNYDLSPAIGIYKSVRQNKKLPLIKLKNQAPARHHIPHDFQRLNYLIDHNICNDQITRQLTKDKKSFQAVHIAPQTNSLNVIIHKKKTRLELAQYLHAACYSPVKSTFKRAIKITT